MSRIDPDALSAQARELFDRAMSMADRVVEDRERRRVARETPPGPPREVAPGAVDLTPTPDGPGPAWLDDGDDDPWATRRDLA